MKKSILAILIVCMMLMPCEIALSADGGVEVTSVAFTDADKTTELSSLYDFYDGVGCSFSYSANSSTDAYGLLLLKKNDKIIDLLEQDFALKSGGGVQSFDMTLTPALNEPGRHKVQFMLFDSKKTMNLITGGEAEITGDVFPDSCIVTSSMALDFEDEAGLKHVIYYRASGTPDNVNIGISYDKARHGSASLVINVEKAWDRFMTASSYNTGVMATKIRGLGDGTYRVSGYVYPDTEDLTFSPRLLVRNTAVNDDQDYNYTQKITVPAGKWTYFAEDYNVEEFFSKGSTLRFGRPQFQIETATKSPLDVYFDDLALTKVDYDVPEMQTEKNIVVKVETEGSVVVKAEKSNGILYALETAEADENGVAEVELSLTSGYNINDTTVTVYADKTYSAKATDALDVDGVKYMDFRYFTSGPVNGVEISKVVVNSTLQPYDEIAIAGGDLVLNASVESGASKNLKLYAVKYTDGVFEDVAVSDTETVNGTEDFEVYLEDVDAGDVVEFFVTDANNTLMSNLYTLDADGLTEQVIPAKAPAFNGEPEAVFNPVNSSAVFTGEAENDSVALLIARPADSDKITESAYIGIKEIGSGDNSVDLPIDTEKFKESTKFVVDYSTVSTSEKGTTEPFAYISQEELESYYDILNDPGVTEEDVEGVITTEALRIDLKDYNKLNSKDAANALKLFNEYNENKDIDSASDIQEILDKSCATVMFCVGISAEAAVRLGETIMPDSEYFKEFKEEGAGFKSTVAELIGKNKISSDKADIEKAEEIFSDAFVTAQLITNAGTYGAYMQMVTETYADDINLDMSGEKSLNRTDIFKYMYTNRKKATNIDGVKSLYREAVSYVKDSKQSSGGSSSGGSGRSGGSSSGGGVAYTNKQEEVVETKPARVLFLDMDDSHWALDAVLFLNSIGVIADAEYYRPDDNVSREEMVKMLVCAFGELDEEAACSFTDVPADAWSYPYIASAFNIGFINGIGENVFGAGMDVSRQDCAVMIYRIVKEKLDIPLEGYELEFTDTADVSDYAVEAVKVLTYNGIINGYGDGSFRPGAAVTRAECAKLITSIFRR